MLIGFQKRIKMKLDNSKKIKKLAQKIKKEQGTNNPYSICKSYNIIILERNYKKQLGAFAIINKTPFIFLNDNISQIEKTNILSHELGHYFLHKTYLKNITILRDYSLFSKKENQMEQEANLFAGYLLVDEEDFYNKLQYGYSIKQLSQYFCLNENFTKIIVDNFYM